MSRLTPAGYISPLQQVKENSDLCFTPVHRFFGGGTVVVVVSSVVGSASADSEVWPAASGMGVESCDF